MRDELGRQLAAEFTGPSEVEFGNTAALFSIVTDL